jgi:hypothetical protein
MSKTLSVAFILIIITALSAIITFAGTSAYYRQIIEFNAQSYAAELQKIREETIKSPTPTPAPQIPEKMEIAIGCPECHGDVRWFHTVTNINRLDILRNRTPRICTTCHGVSIHGIHEALLDREKIDCTDCHQYEKGEISIPKKRIGDLLICEQCHYDGNYIEIHITKGKGSCISCHVGSVGRIHQPAITNIKDLLGGK